MKKETLILGIETSCDETAISVVGENNNILSNIISSQIELHSPFGGVIPEIASRAHLNNIQHIVKIAMEEAQITFGDLNGIAVTMKPGLVGALLVGISFAKGLALALKIPLLGVNHIHGHIYANKMEHPSLSYPFLALVVSGGHTSLYHAKSPLECILVAQTIDDAAGEAFDKVASFLGLPYPGGPSIEKIAKNGKEKAFSFPRTFIHQKDRMAFSFSGLKTSVLYRTRGQDTCRQTKVLDHISIPDVAASFQKAVVDVLVAKTFQGAHKLGVQQIAIGGGVACNQLLREEMVQKGKEEQIEVFFPSKVFCTDNGAMIAGLGHMLLEAGKTSSLDMSANS